MLLGLFFDVQSFAVLLFTVMLCCCSGCLLLSGLAGIMVVAWFLCGVLRLAVMCGVLPFCCNGFGCSVIRLCCLVVVVVFVAGLLVDVIVACCLCVGIHVHMYIGL